MIKRTSYDYLYYSTIANLPLSPEYVRENFTRMWEALDTIIERDYQLRQGIPDYETGDSFNEIGEDGVNVPYDEQLKREGAKQELEKLNELLDLDLDDLMERELAVKEEGTLADKDNGLQELELECIEYHKDDLENIKRIIEKRLKELRQVKP